MSDRTDPIEQLARLGLNEGATPNEASNALRIMAKLVLEGGPQEVDEGTLAALRFALTAAQNANAERQRLLAESQVRLLQLEERLRSASALVERLETETKAQQT